MSKRFRLLLILILICVALAFLYPTIKWYFLVPEEKRELSFASRNQIKLYAQRKAVDILRELQELEADDPLPEEYHFLTDVAKRITKPREEPYPEIGPWSSYSGAI